MTEYTEEHKANLRAGVFAAIEHEFALQRQEKRLRYHLAKLNLALRRQRDGYVIIDRTTAMCEVANLTLDQAEAWLAERKAA